MRKFLLTLAVVLGAAFSAHAQLSDATLQKREAHRNMTIKEWNTDAKSKTRFMDHMTRYDSEGRKVEEAEYTQYGLKWRETYEYGENDKIVKEVVYNEKNKPELIRKYEYDASNRKLKQYNYAPNGKLLHTKVFEYLVN